MRNKKIKSIGIGVFGVSIALLAAFGFAKKTIAAEDHKNGFLVTPTNQTIILNPGESEEYSIKVSNPSSATKNVDYKVVVSPFTVSSEDENYTVNLETPSNFTQMTNWITLDKTEGTVAPNESDIVTFTINVPKDAPAGGQYASINVQNANSQNAEDNSVGISETMEIASLIYATVTGDYKESADVLSNDIPGFLFTNEITATTRVRNTGNTHVNAKYILQVFPLFSNEEIYTNEEKPSEAIIVPDQTYFYTAKWQDGPSVGIYKVVQTVEVAGQTNKKERMVIVCPVWLLLIILFVIFALVFWLIARSKMRKKKAAKA